MDRLLTLSRQKSLHEDRYWRILLHYQNTLWGGVESQVDDPAFFLAPDGKTNPKAELEADIRALFQPEAELAREMVCRFYGRFVWIKKSLGLDASDFSDRVCKEIEAIRGQSASLIFPTYYLNNPASMFGHTLIAIDTDYSNKRLSNAVNYAAVTQDQNGLTFAVSGLFGLYKGYYSVMPYYKKIQEYSDLNQRDIWEYRLNLTPEEIARMVRHIKELENIYTDYYFFDENCSFNLLFLLESARPSAHLVERFPLQAMPVDTIRAVYEEGLIASAEFRPAKATKIKHQMAALGESDRQTALDLLHGDMEIEAFQALPIARERKAHILDLLIDEIQYLYAMETIDRPDYQQHLLKALSARSKLGKIEPVVDDIPPPPRPETEHDSQRVSLGGGARSGEAFQELRLRPAFIDLTDPDYIQDQGAQIEFGDLRCRYYFNDQRFQLTQFDVIDIVSLSARDDFFKPFSWKFNTGLHRKTMENAETSLYYRVNTGGGITRRNSLLGLYYAMLDAEFDIGGALQNNYALGGGLSMGLLKRFSPYAKGHLYGRILRFGLGDIHTTALLALVQNFKLSRNNQLRLELSWEKTRDVTDGEFGVIWSYFF